MCDEHCNMFVMSCYAFFSSPARSSRDTAGSEAVYVMKNAGLANMLFPAPRAPILFPTFKRSLLSSAALVFSCPQTYAEGEKSPAFPGSCRNAPSHESKKEEHRRLLSSQEDIPDPHDS